MTFLLIIFHLIAAVLLGGIAYIYIGSFKELGSISMTRFNRDLNTTRNKIDKETTKGLNDFSFTLFIVVGFFI